MLWSADLEGIPQSAVILRYLRSLLDADGRFPRRQEAETTTFTDATGASRTALVSHEEVQAWADECHDCQLVDF